MSLSLYCADLVWMYYYFVSAYNSNYSHHLNCINKFRLSLFEIVTCHCFIRLFFRRINRNTKYTMSKFVQIIQRNKNNKM